MTKQERLNLFEMQLKLAKFEHAALEEVMRGNTWMLRNVNERADIIRKAQSTLEYKSNLEKLIESFEH